MSSNWEMTIKIKRFDDGYSINAIMPRDSLLVHRTTKEDVTNAIKNNLPVQIKKLNEEHGTEE